MILDVVYNHVGASGTKALHGLRPVLHRTSTRRPGAPGSTSTASTATPSASGSARAPRAGCATSTSTACGWTPSTRSSTRAPSTSWPRSPAASTPLDPGALVIAESGLNDPKVMRVARARRLRLRRRLGRRLPPRAARPADRRDRAAGTRSSTRWRCWPRRSGARTCTTGPTRTFRKRRFGAPADDVPPERFVVFSADHDQVGNRALGDRLPVETRRAGGLLHAPVTLHAHALPGRGVRRAGAVPVLHRSHRPRDRRRDPRGPPARVRRVRRVRGEEVPDPQDVATFERSKLTRDGRARGHARPARASCCAPAASCCRRATSTTSTFDERAGWLAVRRGEYTLLANFARDARARAARAHRGGRPGHARADARARLRRPARARPERWSADGGLARSAVPARRHVGRRGHELLDLLRARRARRAVPVRRRGRRDVRRADRAHVAQLALLPARRARRPALRLPRPRPVRPAVRPSLQPGQAADGPVREVDRGPDPVRQGQRPPVRPAGRRGRRPDAGRRRRRRGDPEVRRHRPALRLAGRPPAEHAARRQRDLRDPRQGLHDAAPGRARGPARHLRRAGLRRRRRLPEGARRDRDRAAAGAPHRRRGVPRRPRADELLGLLDDRLPRARTRPTPRPARPGRRCASSRAWSRRCTRRGSR